MIFDSPTTEIRLSTFVSGLLSHHARSLSYVWAACILLLTILALYKASNRSKYEGIPAVGPTGLFSSWSRSIDFPQKARFWIEEGYKKYRSGIFRIPRGGKWLVVVADDKLVEELKTVPDDVFNVTAAFDEASRYLLGPTIMTNRYHIPIVRNQLTRNLDPLFKDLRDEIILAVEDNIPTTEDWMPVKAYKSITQIVVRTSNRIFVGAPLCRDPDYISININHTNLVSEGVRILGYFPAFLKPLAARYLTGTSKSVERAIKHLRPIIEERQRKIDEYGRDFPDKPNDLLAWLMDEAEGEERLSENLTNRIIHANFAAVHTTSMSFTHALFHLAAKPEYIQPLRDEVEATIKDSGWSKAALSKMSKVDSFLRESQRYNGILSVSIQRKALKDYTFSNGIRVPKGVMVSAAAYQRHHDEEIYKYAAIFDPWRFHNIREKEEGNAQNLVNLVSTSSQYIAFGYGPRACPGRFFVANEMKLLLAHLVLNYDIKMEKEEIRPPNIWSGFFLMPDLTAKVLFRHRRT
ncbi:hypothetical protein M422DRAFT_245133 [Sphaerobolus stellatus SS14]|nr:hypothetical protein M422DRAFT_245133 [Sphaerobolus stellatus SS14]